MSRPAIGTLCKIYVDVSDLSRSSGFWGELLGLEPDPPRSDPLGGRFVDVGAHDGTTPLVLQEVPEEHVLKNRVHLDINVPDLYEAIEDVVSAGGSKIRDMETGFAVMADPDGNEFCLIPDRDAHGG